jgi:hypothetical protein
MCQKYKGYIFNYPVKYSAMPDPGIFISSVVLLIQVIWMAIKIRGLIYQISSAEAILFRLPVSVP